MKVSGYVYETQEKIIAPNDEANKFISELLKIDAGLVKLLLRNELTYFYFRLYNFDPWKLKNLLLATDTFKMEQNKIEADINGYFAIMNRVCDVKKVGVFYKNQVETFEKVFSPLLNVVELLAFIALTEKRIGSKKTDINSNKTKIENCINENNEMNAKIELINKIIFAVEGNIRIREKKAINPTPQKEENLLSPSPSGFQSSFTPFEKRVFSTETIESDISLLRLKFNDLQQKYLKMMKSIKHLVVNPNELNSK